MKQHDDPFFALTEVVADHSEFDALTQRPFAPLAHADAGALNADAPPFNPSMPGLARLKGFDLLDQPLVTGVPTCPGEIVTARSTVALRQAHVGRDVLVMFAAGDPRQPVILGVIEPRPLADEAVAKALLPTAPQAQATIDGDRRIIEAEREVVLRCGDASITLTRAGKVIIKGNYILSRATGYNKIKGAAIDIN
ncbi:MAG: DUF6484 domain-containing protein [Ilumatobacteraceae bacterium]|nr:DUF6484 domain-containing protein [Ilumatobacteraceae bacterium]